MIQNGSEWLFATSVFWNTLEIIPEIFIKNLSYQLMEFHKTRVFFAENHKFLRKPLDGNFCNLIGC